MKNSLPPESEHVAEKLATITSVIRDIMGDNLVMLILFGSYARGEGVSDREVEKGIVYTYESDFDLLMVVEDDFNATTHSKRHRKDAINRRLQGLKLGQPTTIIVEHIGQLNDHLRQGRYFYTEITQQGILLFDNGRHTLAEAGSINPIELQQYTRKGFEYWFNSACQFLFYAEDGVSRGWNNKAAFLLHQATEQLLDAVILTFTHYKPKLHDIEELGRQAISHHADFSTVFPRKTDQEERCFELLKQAYIGARYEEDYVITKEELDYLISRVHILQELTKRVCEEKIATIA